MQNITKIIMAFLAITLLAPSFLSAAPKNKADDFTLASQELKNPKNPQSDYLESLLSNRHEENSPPPVVTPGQPASDLLKTVLEGKVLQASFGNSSQADIDAALKKAIASKNYIEKKQELGLIGGRIDLKALNGSAYVAVFPLKDGFNFKSEGMQELIIDDVNYSYVYAMEQVGKELALAILPMRRSDGIAATEASILVAQRNEGGGVASVYFHGTAVFEGREGGWTLAGSLGTVTDSRILSSREASRLLFLALNGLKMESNKVINQDKFESLLVTAVNKGNAISREISIGEKIDLRDLGGKAFVGKIPLEEGQTFESNNTARYFGVGYNNYSYIYGASAYGGELLIAFIPVEQKENLSSPVSAVLELSQSSTNSRKNDRARVPLTAVTIDDVNHGLGWGEVVPVGTLK